jgi:type III secretory pathway component EscU
MVDSNIAQAMATVEGENWPLRLAVLDDIMAKVVEAIEANTVQQVGIIVALEQISHNIDVLSSILEVK